MPFMFDGENYVSVPTGGYDGSKAATSQQILDMGPFLGSPQLKAALQAQAAKEKAASAPKPAAAAPVRRPAPVPQKVQNLPPMPVQSPFSGAPMPTPGGQALGAAGQPAQGQLPPELLQMLMQRMSGQGMMAQGNPMARLGQMQGMTGGMNPQALMQQGLMGQQGGQQQPNSQQLRQIMMQRLGLMG